MSMGVTNTIGILLIAIVARLLLMPLVAGLAYEITVKWAGNHSENPFVKVLLWPGMQMQRMTTREPDDDMVEVAIAAMTPIIAREELEERRAKGEDVAEERSAGEVPVAEETVEAMPEFTRPECVASSPAVRSRDPASASQS